MGINLTDTATTTLTPVEQLAERLRKIQDNLGVPSMLDTPDEVNHLYAQIATTGQFIVNEYAASAIDAVMRQLASGDYQHSRDCYQVSAGQMKGRLLAFLLANGATGVYQASEDTPASAGLFIREDDGPGQQLTAITLRLNTGHYGIACERVIELDVHTQPWVEKWFSPPRHEAWMGAAGRDAERQPDGSVVSPRSLQRRLLDENTRFAGFVARYPDQDERDVLELFPPCTFAVGFAVDADASWVDYQMAVIRDAWPGLAVTATSAGLSPLVAGQPVYGFNDDGDPFVTICAPAGGYMVVTAARVPTRQ